MSKPTHRRFSSSAARALSSRSSLRPNHRRRWREGRHRLHFDAEGRIRDARRATARHSSTSPHLLELHRQHVDVLDARRLRQQLVCTTKERSRDGAVQMRRAPRLTREHVEDPEGSLTEPDGTTRLSPARRLLAAEHPGGLRQLVLAPGLCLEPDEQSDSDHSRLFLVCVTQHCGADAVPLVVSVATGALLTPAPVLVVTASCALRSTRPGFAAVRSVAG